MSEKPFHIPSVETHLIESRCVDQTYKIQVMQPLMRKGGTERFPVVYITDGNLSFDVAKAISHCLQMAGQVRRFILVGIGYPGDNPFVGNVLRWRDFTSHRRTVIPGVPRDLPIDGVPTIESGKKQWHGASDFLAFIRNELTVFIDGNYPTLANDRTYVGHSLGGGLGLHALFAGAAMFNRYVLISPSISYGGDEYGIQEAKEFIASGRRLDAHVFMAVGEQEEFDAAAEPQFVSSFYRLAALLRKANIPDLQFSCRVIPGETHASVFPIAFTHGIQVVHGPGERPLVTAGAEMSPSKL